MTPTLRDDLAADLRMINARDPFRTIDDLADRLIALGWTKRPPHIGPGSAQRKREAATAPLDPTEYPHYLEAHPEAGR